MFLHYRTQGIILKKEDRGEADQLFTIYTKDFGKLEILGKAIRKIASKLRSGADIFYLSEIEFIQGKTYKILTDAILVKKFENLRPKPSSQPANLERLKIAYKISEVLDRLIKGQEPDQKIWQLLTETLDKLNNLSFDISHLLLVYYYFLWNLLSILGHQPELYNCPLCQKKLTPERLYFSPKEGGVICQQCQRLTKSAKKITPDLVKILRVFLKRDWSILNRLKIEAQDLNLLKKISNYFLDNVQ
jgi:DNA repair protein RecO (recombination protein O)